MPTSD